MNLGRIATSMAAPVLFGTAIWAQTVSPAAAQQRPERPEGGRGPSEAMLAACSGKQEADACSVANADGTEVAGTCRAPKGKAPACLPEGMGPPPGRQGGPRSTPDDNAD
ncbi:hypothetical protein [Croceicoccus sp. Ery5]|uniref:hypothetical protein n=1 Tax=Croceicoccus sp. Ery5 TaxID=1703340 RepID=UPI001E44A7F0|nr:hypothetical protein [Croceicoccus sp. Ery5]